jgi:thioredoxin reductase (NADPH)
MADLSERLDEIFPRLTAGQIARLLPLGRRRLFRPGAVIYERGSAKRAFYVVLDGRVEITSPARAGEERVAVQSAGQFMGEVDMISGRHSLVRALAQDATEVLQIDLTELRHIVQTDPSATRASRRCSTISGSVRARSRC